MIENQNLIKQTENLRIMKRAKGRSSTMKIKQGKTQYTTEIKNGIFYKKQEILKILRFYFMYK